jgi:hypothetical protein
MARGTGAPRVVAGESVRRGGATLRGPSLGLRRKLLVRTSGLSEARRRLVVRGGDLSEKLSPSGRLVEETPNWLETRRLARDGLDRGSQSSLS